MPPVGPDMFEFIRDTPSALAVVPKKARRARKYHGQFVHFGISRRLFSRSQIFLMLGFASNQLSAARLTRTCTLAYEERRSERERDHSKGFFIHRSVGYAGQPAQRGVNIPPSRILGNRPSAG